MMEEVAVVIVAGGSGKRMGMAIKKQYILLNDKEIIAHTVEQFEKCRVVDEIILVVGAEEIKKVREEIVKKYGFNKVRHVVAGGAERQDSVYNGLLVTSSNIKYVMVHDGARPFIKEEIIIKALEKTRKKEATVVAVPVKDTIKIADNKTGIIVDTPNRNNLWSVQTPQSFSKQLLLDAYEYAQSNNLIVTDDSMLVEAYGRTVSIVEGDYTNIKITTQEDLIVAESILARNKNKNDG